MRNPLQTLEKVPPFDLNNRTSYICLKMYGMKQAPYTNNLRPCQPTDPDGPGDGKMLKIY